MDLLSDIISVSRLGRPHSARVHRRSPFHRRLAQSEAAGFHVVLRGTCWVAAPGFEPAQLRPGDIVFFPRGSAHALMEKPTAVSFDGDQETSSNISIEQLESTENCRVKNALSANVAMLCGAYLLDRSCFHPLLEEMPEMLHFPAEAGAQWQLRATIELLGAEVDRGLLGVDTAICALLDLMFLYILRTWLAESSHRRRTAGWSAALKDSRIAAALAGIHSEPAKPWTVATLASAAGLSRAAFARRFSSLLGQSPAAYLTLWRMMVATRLMRDSDLQLAAIAAQIGYSSEYAFAHAFKRLHGISPGAYHRGWKKPGG
ncbi:MULTISPECIES: AraC family transcriptional regulator [unclassified Bradyrhizobium]|uniref:AraC family transcriptional regulator n=1 Tax=unclassified Bradyrhizobium TaxID=2631580 RepID=UPI00102E60FE|nr:MULTISPECIES: AraC family transcriptional regulator [unclassified Bradyrhizobium]MDI4235473.1 AraC family transcriptional regulator [Bradyrhizobium sp. Arg237L]TAI67345.1 AraC family transcriptional regulator [Bradyrhizobium sp. Leo170]